MKLKISYAELHTGLFLGGTNFGTKLDSSKRTDLKMTYDKEEKELVIEWNGKTAFLPSTSVASYQVFEEKKPEEIRPTHKSHPQKRGIASAQVQTPMGHVFQGEGAGQTGRG